MLQQVLLYLHVIGATVLFGTGAGIAFFMVMANRTRDAGLIAHVAGTVVIADSVFTAVAAIVQPITGAWLAWLTGWPLTSGWVLLALLLYGVVGAFWLPVVWIQMRLRDLARCGRLGNFTAGSVLAALPDLVCLRLSRLFRGARHPLADALQAGPAMALQLAAHASAHPTACEDEMSG